MKVRMTSTTMKQNQTNEGTANQFEDTKLRILQTQTNEGTDP